MPDDRERSVSHDIESSEAPSPNDDGTSQTPAVGKPGRKKNPNSQAARRDQNRIAQREFRLRKQQRIRDLEASVEILSGGKDEALSQLRKVLKDLMAENQVLRGLLKSLSGFIGEGAGGIVSKVGWELSEFNDLINKAETDTAWESYQRHKRDTSESAPGPSGSGSQKRPADDSDPYGLRPKRPRAETNGESRSNDNFPLLVPLNPTVSSMGPNGLYPPGRPHDGSLLTDYGRGPSSASPMFVPPSSPPVNNQSGPYGSSMPFQSPYGSGMSMTGDPMSSMTMVNSSMAPMSGSSRTQSTAQSTPQQQQQQDDEEIDPKKMDAYKLIHYHLDNWKRNNNYCLPSSLRPTLVQRTIPHESVIDGVLHPELRDRMILLRERFNLVDCLHDYRHAVIIHGDDVLAHNNWEISETWLQRYKFLVDPTTLNITNKWRRERGDPELHGSEYSTEQPNQV
ncbi:hypothetical protein L226DRAFT_487155 [Lentinus tigrinus ALCF2SS1-7]|uniref:BZIP domain-containing protein n=1 Tax=Lentinus tigrinus ALCF2SS1-6 TaxID=1328759 RepID=A0A5C2SDS1_9APHY|nr:hypothetical protein L227DRAFT_44070 [Lentinus tigrinus ALCF2SS1-6]RPD74419.1 hypothetical protein L226DRAFT_487155 [Lentinus tigrinus ALCF2SS1-7]